MGGAKAEYSAFCQNLAATTFPKSPNAFFYEVILLNNVGADCLSQFNNAFQRVNGFSSVVRNSDVLVIESICFNICEPVVRVVQRFFRYIEVSAIVGKDTFVP